MISKRLYLIIIIFIIGISLVSCSKNDQETDYVEFLGTESYFKFTDEIIPDILIDTLIHYSDSVGYNYLNLYNQPPFATKIEGEYIVNQNIFINYKDPFERNDNTIFSTKLSFKDQKNSILSMNMSLDTVLPTSSPYVNLVISDHCVADTLFIVGENGDTGHFMMYGIASYEVERANVIVETSEIIPASHQNYIYKSIIIIVGEKVNEGIKRIAFFDYISEVTDLEYPVGSIKAFADSDDMSYLIN